VTVQTEISRSGPYAGAGTTGPFTVGFRFLASSHLQVIRTSADGLDVTLALTTDYSVSGAGGSSGSVTLVVALASGERLTIVRDVPFTQLADYVENDAFPAESHENALDLLTMQTQQLDEISARSLTLPATVAGVSTELPSPEAGKVIGWNATGTELQNLDASTLASIVAYGTAVSNLFSGDGVQTSFVLSENPGSLNNLDISVGGVAQRPGIDYFWTAGTTLTFSVAPVAGVSNVLARYMQALAFGSSVASDVFYIGPNSESTNVQEIAGPDGASLVGYTPAGTGAVQTDVQSQLRKRIYVSQFLPIGFNTQTTDCTQYIQKAVNFAVAGVADWWGLTPYAVPRVIEFDTQFYKVLGTVYVPSGVVIDLKKSTLIGSGFSITDNVMFETGYASAGVVISNIASANDVDRVTDTQIINGRITNCYKAFNLKNFNENCSLKNIVFSNCRISFKSYRGFYSTYENLFSRSDDAALFKVATEASYWFLSSINAIGMYNVHASGRVYGFLIDGYPGEGTRATVMDKCGAEECITGVYFSNAVQPMAIINSYFEYCSTCAIDMQYASIGNIKISGNWFGSCGIGVRGDTISDGEIDSTNAFVSCTQNVVIPSNTAARCVVEITPTYTASNAASTRPVLDPKYVIGTGVEVKNTQLIYSVGTGTPQVRQNYTGGLIDLPYSGKGGSIAGLVPFCDITYSGGTVNYSAYIDTKIVYDDYNFLIFKFNTVDSNFNDIFQGRIYGTDVVYDRQDHGKTVVVSNVGGFVRLTLGLLNGAGGTATITGVLRHM